jgi:hypothetical protein
MQKHYLPYQEIPISYEFGEMKVVYTAPSATLAYEFGEIKVQAVIPGEVLYYRVVTTDLDPIRDDNDADLVARRR